MIGVEGLGQQFVGVVVAMAKGYLAAILEPHPQQRVITAVCPLCAEKIAVSDSKPGSEWVCQPCARVLGWDGCTHTVTRTFKVSGTGSVKE